MAQGYVFTCVPVTCSQGASPWVWAWNPPTGREKPPGADFPLGTDPPGREDPPGHAGDTYPPEQTPWRSRLQHTVNELPDTHPTMHSGIANFPVFFWCFVFFTENLDTILANNTQLGIALKIIFTGQECTFEHG